MSDPDQTESRDVLTDGERARARRNRLGVNQAEVAEQAGVNRDTVGAVEADKAGDRSRAQVEAALTAMEEESGLPPFSDDPPTPRGHVESEGPGIVRIRLEGVFGADAAVIEAPADNPDALAAALDLIMRRMKADEPEQ